MQLNIYSKEKSFEDNYTLSHLETIFTKKRNYSFRMPQRKKSVILLLSGGLDSVCLWTLLMEKYNLVVYPIYFNNLTRRSEGQEESIKVFSRLFKNLYPCQFREVFKVDYSPLFSFSKLSNKEKIIQDLPMLTSNLLLNKDKKGYVSIINNPPRLARFAIGAYEYAYLLKFSKNIDVDTIFVALLPEDSRTLRESTLTVLRSINLYFCLVLGDFSWQFTAPLEKKGSFFYTKKSLISYAFKKNLPFEKTWSCFQKRIHCGKCLNCISRKKVFQKLGFTDKTKYETDQEKSLAQFIRSKLKMESGLYRGVRRIKKYLSKKRKIKKSLTKLDPVRCFSISSDVVWSEKGDQFNVLNKKSGDFMVLNKTACFIFKSLAVKPRNYCQLLKIMEKKYQVNKKRIKDDLDKFLRICFKKQILTQY